MAAVSRPGQRGRQQGRPRTGAPAGLQWRPQHSGRTAWAPTAWSSRTDGSRAEGGASAAVR
eukprot:9672468-Lingulodinium_polyedra.AAC.1